MTLTLLELRDSRGRAETTAGATSAKRAMKEVESFMMSQKVQWGTIVDECRPAERAWKLENDERTRAQLLVGEDDLGKDAVKHLQLIRRSLYRQGFWPEENMNDGLA